MTLKKGIGSTTKYPYVIENKVLKRKYILKKDQQVIDCIFIGFLSVLINLSQ